jgi:hypothetical protein
MKKRSSAILVFALIAVCLTSAHAIPTGKSNESGDYLSGTGLSDRLSAGVYTGSIEREVKDLDTLTVLESKHSMIYLGLDLTRWLTLFVSGGMADHQVDLLESDSSQKVEAGVLLNLIDHDILDSSFFEDKLRLNAGASWGHTEAEWLGREVSWQEGTAFITLSIVNDTTGNKIFNPNSVSVYVGPLYNYIKSDDIELEDNFGFMAGIEVFMTDHITLDLGLRHMDAMTYEGGVHIRF